MSIANPGALKTYFWMVHYVLPQAEAEQDELKPIAAGKGRFMVVVHRNVYGNHSIGFTMPREGEFTPDAANYRGSSAMRNRIIGFYATQEEANKHMTPKLWTELQKIGAVYAELHGVKLDVAESEAETLKLVA